MRMKWMSGNERQLRSFHYANRGNVTEHSIGEIKKFLQQYSYTVETSANMSLRGIHIHRLI